MDHEDLNLNAKAEHPSLERVPGKQNWVDKSGGLPSYIDRIARNLHYERGMTISHSIATAVNTVKRWCQGGTVSKTKGPTKTQNVTAATRAKACAALAQWNAKKAKSGVNAGLDRDAYSDQDMILELSQEIANSGAWDREEDEFDHDAYELYLALERSGEDVEEYETQLSIFRWDPRKHPRDILGRFREVFNALDELVIGDELRISGEEVDAKTAYARSIKRLKDGFDVDGTKVGSAQEAAEMAVREGKTMAKGKASKMWASVETDTDLNLTIFRWDPRKHPRDLLGRFREVFNALEGLDVGDEFDAPGLPNVKKVDGGFDVGGGQVVDALDAAEKVARETETIRSDADVPNELKALPGVDSILKDTGPGPSRVYQLTDRETGKVFEVETGYADGSVEIFETGDSDGPYEMESDEWAMAFQDRADNLMDARTSLTEKILEYREWMKENLAERDRDMPSMAGQPSAGDIADGSRVRINGGLMGFTGTGTVFGTDAPENGIIIMFDNPRNEEEEEMFIPDEDIQDLLNDGTLEPFDDRPEGPSRNFVVEGEGAPRKATDIESMAVDLAKAMKKEYGSRYIVNLDNVDGTSIVIEDDEDGAVRYLLGKGVAGGGSRAGSEWELEVEDARMPDGGDSVVFSKEPTPKEVADAIETYSSEFVVTEDGLADLWEGDLGEIVAAGTFNGREQNRRVVQGAAIEAAQRLSKSAGTKVEAVDEGDGWYFWMENDKGEFVIRPEMDAPASPWLLTDAGVADEAIESFDDLGDLNNKLGGRLAKMDKEDGGTSPDPKSTYDGWGRDMVNSSDPEVQQEAAENAHERLSYRIRYMPGDIDSDRFEVTPEREPGVFNIFDTETSNNFYIEPLEDDTWLLSNEANGAEARYEGFSELLDNVGKWVKDQTEGVDNESLTNWQDRTTGGNSTDDPYGAKIPYNPADLRVWGAALDKRLRSIDMAEATDAAILATEALKRDSIIPGRSGLPDVERYEVTPERSPEDGFNIFDTEASNNFYVEPMPGSGWMLSNEANEAEIEYDNFGELLVNIWKWIDEQSNSL